MWRCHHGCPSAIAVKVEVEVRPAPQVRSASTSSGDRKGVNRQVAATITNVEPDRTIHLGRRRPTDRVATKTAKIEDVPDTERPVIDLTFECASTLNRRERPMPLSPLKLASVATTRLPSGFQLQANLLPSRFHR